MATTKAVTKKAVTKKAVTKTAKPTSVKPLSTKSVKPVVVKKTAAKSVKPAVKKTATKSKDAIIHFVLDRSGSMASIWNEAINAANNFISEQQKAPGKCKFSFSVFDGNYDSIYDMLDVKKMPALTQAQSQYSPRGMTALYDAIGKTLNHELNLKVPKSTLRIIAIQTDGQENSSKEFSLESTKDLVKKATDLGWQVVFLGANLDVAAFTRGVGIAAAASSSYDTAMVGSTYNATSALSAATVSYRGGKSRSINLADHAQDYFNDKEKNSKPLASLAGKEAKLKK